MAEWTKISESEDDGGYTAYADLDSIRDAGNRVKMWSLIDYNLEQKTPGADFLSKSIRREYDCQGKHIRTLAFKLFSWNMEQGKLVRSYNQPRQWEKVQTEQLDKIGWNIACSKE